MLRGPEQALTETGITQVTNITDQTLGTVMLYQGAPEPGGGSWLPLPYPEIPVQLTGPPHGG